MSQLVHVNAARMTHSSGGGCTCGNCNRPAAPLVLPSPAPSMPGMPSLNDLSAVLEGYDETPLIPPPVIPRPGDPVLNTARGFVPTGFGMGVPLDPAPVWNGYGQDWDEDDVLPPTPKEVPEDDLAWRKELDEKQRAKLLGLTMNAAPGSDDDYLPMPPALVPKRR